MFRVANCYSALVTSNGSWSAPKLVTFSNHSMGILTGVRHLDALSPSEDERPLIVIGITHSQTCLVLKGRLSALRDAGFRVILISSPGPILEDFVAREDVEYLSIPMHRGISPFADAVSLFRLIRALFRLHPDITEFSTPKAGLLGSLAALFCGVPHRIYALRGLRLETASGLTRGILCVAEKLAAACCHIVLCNSNSLREKTLALRVAGQDKLRMLGHGTSNGVDVRRFTPGATDLRSDLGISANVPVIGFVGRLTCDKGVPELVEAFDELLRTVPEAQLLLVGWYDKSDDALPLNLRARIERHPNIILTGFVANTTPYYRAMDLMVLPTHREGFPNVVLEASATCIPVITTLVTGSRDAVLAEVTGLLVPAGCPEAITEAMLRLIRDAGLRRRMGAAGRDWVMQHFQHTQVQAHAMALYSDLLRAECHEALPEQATGASAAAD